MPAIIPAYLVYLAAAAIGGLVACSSKDSEPDPNQAPQNPEPPQTPPLQPLCYPTDAPVFKNCKHILDFDMNSPDYKIYAQLKNAGLTDREIDRTSWKWSPWGPEIRNPKPSPWDVELRTQKKNGRISDVDLRTTAESLSSTPSPFKKIVDETVKTVADEYIPAEFSQGDPSRFCQNDVPFQKALFWNPNNHRARYIMGICRPSETFHLFQAIKAQPDFLPAKVALEKYYREELKKNPRDPFAQMNLGYALKVQGKYDEALSTYKTLLHLLPGLPSPKLGAIVVHWEILDVYLLQGKKAEALAQDKIIQKILGKPKPSPWDGPKPDEGIDLRKAPPPPKPELEFLPLWDTPYEAQQPPPPPEPKVKRKPGAKAPWNSPKLNPPHPDKTNPRRDPFND